MKEGRFRPSFDPGFTPAGRRFAASMKEGRFRPSFIPPEVFRGRCFPASMKEGRFRPSFLWMMKNAGHDPIGLNEGGSVPTLVLRAIMWSVLMRC